MRNLIVVAAIALAAPQVQAAPDIWFGGGLTSPMTAEPWEEIPVNVSWSGIPNPTATYDIFVRIREVNAPPDMYVYDTFYSGDPGASGSNDFGDWIPGMPGYYEMHVFIICFDDQSPEFLSVVAEDFIYVTAGP